jgi:hypothetical protein
MLHEKRENGEMPAICWYTLKDVGYLEKVTMKLL